jgi:putative serine protease PepD
MANEETRSATDAAENDQSAAHDGERAAGSAAAPSAGETNGVSAPSVTSGPDAEAGSDGTPGSDDAAGPDGGGFASAGSAGSTPSAGPDAASPPVAGGAPSPWAPGYTGGPPPSYPGAPASPGAQPPVPPGAIPSGAVPGGTVPGGPVPPGAVAGGAATGPSPYPGAPTYPGAAPHPGVPPHPGAPTYPGGPAYPGARPYPGPAGQAQPPYPGVDAPTAQLAAGPPTAQLPAPTGSGSASRPWALLAVLALLVGLLGGLLGGVIGYQVAKSGSGGGLIPGLGASSTDVTAVEEVSQRVLPSVVQLRLKSGERSGAGSGMVLTPDGLLLTNNHVIEAAAGGAGQITVLFQDGRSAPAQIIGRDPESDIALVKAANMTGLKPIELGNSDAVKVGQQVIAVGSPLGLGGTVTTGIVSALNRAVSVGGEPGENGSVLNAIQTDAAINPGNSGGPLVDIEGKLVGINSAIATVGGGPQDEGGSVGLGFSIPINQARRIADELERTGQATKPVLGVMVESGSRLAPLSNPPGATLKDVTPNGPGSKAGLKAGDLVVRVNQRVITYGDELVAAIRSQAPGDTVQLTLADGRTLSAVLGSQPVPASK